MAQSANIENALRKFAQDVVRKSRINLGARRTYTDTDGKRKTKIIDNTGTLRKSLAYEMNVSPNSFSLAFLMEEYGEWVDLGRKKGKGVPPEALRKWVRQKPIRPRDKDGKFIAATKSNVNSLAYLINRKIKNFGIRETRFFSEPFEEEFDKLPDELIEAYALEVERFLNFTANR